MRNYVVINGVSSLTIPGLAIKDLPSISKPLMRNQKEEVDGRDGDIITELGYSAYDKTMTIGLYGSYDINQIIAFFNQKGTITFSDEADKFYNFTILEKIDYDKLVKFRTASVKFHCQPFKYPLTETPGTTEAEFVTGTGENLTLNNTTTASMDVDLKGNTYQETTTGKNLIRFPYDATSGTYGNVAVTMNNDGSVTFSGTGNGAAYVNIITQGNKIHLGAGTYTLSTKNAGIEFTIRDTAGNLGYIARTQTSATFTLSEAKDVYLYFAVRNGISYNVTIYPMLETGSSATEWEKPTNGASPNPDYPQEVQVVTGDNTIKVCGINLWDEETILGYYNDNGVWQTRSDILSSKNPIYVNPSESYYFKAPSQAYYTQWTSNGTFISRTNIPQGYGTLTLNSNCAYILFNLLAGYGTTYNHDIMISYGTTATPYTPYQSQEYEINLGTLELCKIGTYQDYIYKSGENWYKKAYIGKVVLNGSESWNKGNDLRDNSYLYTATYDNLIGAESNEITGICDKLIAVTGITYVTKNNFVINTAWAHIRLYIDKNIFSGSAEDFATTWLPNNNITLYYVLATPTEEQITNAKLIEQLNDILNAVSYEDQTNIAQDNDNLPFILDVSALKKGTNEITINNTGNIYSKPIINIKGNGTIGVHLNGVQVFTIDMSTYHEITIDMANLEAYEPNLNILLNRQVTGNYENFKLEPGNNTISLSGGFIEATVTRYIRWL